MSQPVIIVGGGLAGLAAAVGLGSQGVPAIVLESRPRLGGRAGSFTDRETGETIDNCQHVSMGCCTNYNFFCETVGISGAFRREETLYFVGPDDTVNAFRASSAPAPLHLAAAFAGLSYLTWGEKAKLALGLRAICKPQADDATLLDWLHRRGQPAAVIERFWKVVMVSALSESLDRIALPAARKVIVDGFLTHRHAWEVLIPTQPLDELYGTTVSQWCRGHDVQVRLQTGVESLVVNDVAVSAVRLRSGEELSARHFVLAVPFQRVADLLPEEWSNQAPFVAAERLEHAPISSVHLWFEDPVMPLPHAVFVGRLTQWVFNRSMLQTSKHEADDRAAESSDGQYCQAVISDSRELSGRSQQEIIGEVVADMARIWPEAGATRLRHARVVTEHRAVFSPLPTTERLRPVQQSPITNLQLAGDWTATGWPATMEGAVRSGFLAAENILRQLGRPANVLQPDLRTSRWSRWLLPI